MCRQKLAIFPERCITGVLSVLDRKHEAVALLEELSSVPQTYFCVHVIFGRWFVCNRGESRSWQGAHSKCVQQIFLSGWRIAKKCFACTLWPKFYLFGKRSSLMRSMKHPVHICSLNLREIYFYGQIVVSSRLYGPNPQNDCAAMRYK